MGSTFPFRIVYIRSIDKSDVDSRYHTSSDLLEHASITLNYNVDLL